ncbi:hypothetical protein NC652_034181 [Populus alba x Populus x berolinensis]|nr:hypothetical protein NC652_034181 [Populus alba x Populus x berolinensis]
MGLRRKLRKFSNLEVGSSKWIANDIFPSSSEVKTFRNQRHERREEVEMAEDHSQVATKRQALPTSLVPIHLSRSPDKSKKSGSSVIFIKAIPTSNKSGRNITKNRPQGHSKKQVVSKTNPFLQAAAAFGSVNG